MTPTAKPLGQSLAAEIMFNAEISFTRRISNKANQKISNCSADLVGDCRKRQSAAI